MSFPEQLKRARISMGYTQQQVADAMGITNSTYCGYETGKRSPDVAKIKQLAAILCTSGDFLLETGFACDSDLQPELEETALHQARQFSRLSSDFQKIVSELTEQLLKAQEHILLQKEESSGSNNLSAGS